MGGVRRLTLMILNRGKGDQAQRETTNETPHKRITQKRTHTIILTE